MEDVEDKLGAIILQVDNINLLGVQSVPKKMSDSAFLVIAASAA